MLALESNIPIQKINIDFLEKNGIEVFIKREDLIHPEISGNKWRKLKYNVQRAKALDCNKIITFGGAFSNHISATAASGKLNGLKTIGVIRGEEVLPLNPTLKLAQENGMEFLYVSRSDYRRKDEDGFLEELGIDTSKSFVIPEGGANKYGLLGCKEIVEGCEDYDLFVCACGTANTLSGIISELGENQKAIGIPVLKNAGFLKEEVFKNLEALGVKMSNWDLNLDFHFGGYAKQNSDLISFIQDFWRSHQIKLDPIYTGKAMYGLLELIKNGEIKSKKILFIHTGGLQGVAGFEERYKLTLFKGTNH